MDAVFRRRRSLLIGGACGLALVACFGRGGGERDANIGVSDKPPGGRNPADGGVAQAIDGAAALPADYRTKFTKVNKTRLVSRGHADGRWEIDVWANDLAAKALAERSHAVPVGAIVVAEHFEVRDKAKSLVLVMEKRPAGTAKEHGDWRWASVGSQGQLAGDGTIETCAGCHDDSPMDGLFPLPE